MTIESDIEDIKEGVDGIKRALRFFIDEEIDRRVEALEKEEGGLPDTRAQHRWRVERDFKEILDGLR